jgi:GMP synthase-like glutamine amidotransferase
LIARRIREVQVYCGLFPGIRREAHQDLNPKGYILSGGRHSVYDADAPEIPLVIQSGGGAGFAMACRP